MKLETKPRTFSSVLAVVLTVLATLAVMPLHPLFIAIPIIVAFGTMRMVKGTDYAALQVFTIPITGIAYCIAAGLCGVRVSSLLPYRKTMILPIDNMSAFMYTAIIALAAVVVSAIFAGHILANDEKGARQKVAGN